MKFTLRTKLIILTTFVVTITMANVTYFFTIRELRERGNSVEAQMARVARNIASMQFFKRQSWNDYQNYIDQLMTFNDDIVYIAIRDDRNWLRASTLNTDFIELPDDRSLSQRERSRIVERLDEGLIAEESRKDLRMQRVNIQSGDRVIGSVHVGFSMIDINNEESKRIGRNIQVALVFIFFFSTIAFLLSRRVSGPIERLSAAMASLAAGRGERKVRVESKDEIGQLAKTFNKMVEGLRERKIIETLRHEMSASFRLEHLAKVVRHRLSEAVNAENARLFLRQRNANGQFQEVNSAGKAQHVSFDEDAAASLRNGLHGFVVTDAPVDLRNVLATADVDQRDLVLPMQAKNHLLGFVVLRHRPQADGFDARQAKFAAALAGHAAVALENALLYEELKAQERIKREFEIAREVQQKLLPDKMPKFGGFQFEGVCLPAQEIGGDYYDFFGISEHKLGIVIADVSGKGTSAAFYMAEIKGMMSSMAYIYDSPKNVLCEVNRRLYASVDRNVFATIIYGILDCQRRKFTFVRAGHDALLHIKKDNQCHALTPRGIGVGLETGEIFTNSLEEDEIALQKGESLLLFTDGITESMNRDREEFGQDRLVKAISSCNENDPAKLTDKILRAVESFTAGADQHDDLTMIIIRNA